MILLKVWYNLVTLKLTFNNAKKTVQSVEKKTLNWIEKIVIENKNISVKNADIVL